MMQHTYQYIREEKACSQFWNLILTLQLGAFQSLDHHFRRKGELLGGEGQYDKTDSRVGWLCALMVLSYWRFVVRMWKVSRDQSRSYLVCIFLRGAPPLLSPKENCNFGVFFCLCNCMECVFDFESWKFCILIWNNPGSLELFFGHIEIYALCSISGAWHVWFRIISRICFVVH